MPSPEILKRRLEAAALFAEEAARDLSKPLDRLLARFFHARRGRAGASDRRVISDAAFAIFRHKLLVESWLDSPAALLFHRAAYALAAEGLLDAETFAGLVARDDARKVHQNLSRGQIPDHLQNLSPDEKLAIRYSFPLWLVQKWVRTLGPQDAEHLLRAMNQRAPLVLRANPWKISRDELLRRLRDRGMETEPTPLSPWGVRVERRFQVPGLAEFRKGLFEIQDEASQLVVLALDPKPGETVWDVCAGGGGKTLFIAGLMENRGRVLATEVRTRKLDEVKKRAARAGLSNIFPAERGLAVDKLLIDAPCSGTGTLRRNPDAKWKVSPEILEKNHGTNLQILESHAPCLRKGGILVYATCSLEPEENDDVIEAFLDRHGDFCRFQHDRYLFPHSQGTDGFYIAKLTRD
jgi:16S rRNA (cytosine967-C5)-methyltransferase